MTELQLFYTKGYKLERAGASWTAGTAAAVLQPSNGTNSRFSGIADVNTHKERRKMENSVQNTLGLLRVSRYIFRSY